MEKDGNRVMVSREQKLKGQVDNQPAARGDATAYHPASPGLSTPSRSSGEDSDAGESETSNYSSDFEDYEDFEHKNKSKALAARSSAKRQGLRKQEKKAPKGPTLQKGHTGTQKAVTFPPIKPTESSKQLILSSRRDRIKELNNLVWDLQQQLSGSTSENKLLRKLLRRHTVALQHFQDSEHGLPQILSKHSNEVRALEELLRNTRNSRKSLARQLRAIEDELFRTKDSLQRLKLLSEDRSLLDREELTHKLSKATAELDRNNKKIQDLEKNLELCQSSFSRQIAIETKKTIDSTKMVSLLEEHITQLNHKIKEKDRELDIQNIYAHRFLKELSRKGKKTKMVQTEEAFPVLDVSSPLGFDNQKTEEEQEESSANEYPDAEDLGDKSDNGPDDTDEQKERSDEDPEPPDEAGGNEDRSVSHLEGLEEQTEMCDSSYSKDLLSESTDATNMYKFPRIRRHYAFKQTILNLHAGKPAYFSLDKTPLKCISNETMVENQNPNSGLQEPSFLSFTREKPEASD